MTIFIEIIIVLWQAFLGTLKAFGTAIWDNLPAILEIKKVMGYFTPAGMIALYLGVPTIVISILFLAVRKIIKAK
mgnify:FL=1